MNLDLDFHVALAALLEEVDELAVVQPDRHICHLTVPAARGKWSKVDRLVPRTHDVNFDGLLHTPMMSAEDVDQLAVVQPDRHICHLAIPGSEAGSYLRHMDLCTTQLLIQES